MKWLFPKNHPPAVKRYLAGTPKRPPSKQPLEELYLLVIDAESTGFNAQRDKILSFAGVEVRSAQINVGAMHSWIIHQPDAKVNAAAQVHCILPSDTETGLPESDLVEQLLPFLTGAVLVGHHVAFDAALLDEALQRHFDIRLRNPLIDTAMLSMKTLEAFAKTGYANQRPPTFDEVCSHLELDMLERHTAAGDAFTTAELFLLLCAKLRQRLKRPILAGDLGIARL